MKTLIIGGGGFVGKYLVYQLADLCGWETTVTKLPQETINCENCKICDLNLLDKDAVKALLEQERPNVIFHLAAQSSVAVSWKRPQLTVDINVNGCLNLLESLREMEDYSPRVILIGSAEEYGSLPRGVSLVTEETPSHPGNPYAITKMMQEQFGLLYAKAYHMDILAVRAFNHIGPGQLPQFVVADFCKQAAEIALGMREPIMRTGNLSAARDFTDVRDIVRAYALLAEHGKSGEVYNVGNGKATVIQDLLTEIVAQSGADITVETDPAKLRPVDIPIIEADITKLQIDTGWEPQIPIRQTIQETLAYWTEEAKKNG